MPRSHHSVADDDLTQPRGGFGDLASGITRRDDLDDGHTAKIDSWPDEVLDENWGPESEEPPGVAFLLEGDERIVHTFQRGLVTVTEAEGVVKRIDEDRLWLGTPGARFSDVSLCYSLPASVDLRPLVGRRVLLQLTEEVSPGEASSQTLTVHTFDGRVWLIARYGGSAAVAYNVDGVEVRAAPSPRVGGPLVVGLPDLQWLVAVGGAAQMTVGKWRLVVEHVSRDRAGYCSYLIADGLLWH